jgi:hypothetical protein
MRQRRGWLRRPSSSLAHRVTHARLLWGRALPWRLWRTRQRRPSLQHHRCARVVWCGVVWRLGAVCRHLGLACAKLGTTNPTQHPQPTTHTPHPPVFRPQVAAQQTRGVAQAAAAKLPEAAAGVAREAAAVKEELIPRVRVHVCCASCVQVAAWRLARLAAVLSLLQDCTAASLATRQAAAATALHAPRVAHTLRGCMCPPLPGTHTTHTAVHPTINASHACMRACVRTARTHQVAPLGPAAGETITTVSQQAAAATAAITQQVATAAPELAQGLAEGTLKPAAAEAAQALPQLAQEVGAKLVVGEGEAVCIVCVCGGGCTRWC